MLVLLEVTETSACHFCRSLAAVSGRFLFPTAVAHGKANLQIHIQNKQNSVSVSAVSGCTCSVDCHQMKIVLKGI